MNKLERCRLLIDVADKKKRMEVKTDIGWREVIIGTTGNYVVDLGVDHRNLVLDGLSDLLMDEIRELVKPFKPKFGEEYWCWANCGVINETFCCNIDIQRYAFGNCFRSKAECFAHHEIKEKLEAVWKELE